MLISCPNCAAAYEVPDNLLAAGGQALQCTRCAHEWIVVPVAATPQGPADESAPAPPSSPSRLAGRLQVSAVVAAWVLSLGVLGSLGWSAVHWRGDVMAAWPPSQRAYQAVGLN
jgi:predicted Zn finger-like uncharacterized protein